MLNHKFLSDVPSRGPWPSPTGTPASITPVQYWLGNDERYPLDVLFAESPSRPLRDPVRNVWKGWRGNRPSPALLVIGYDTPSGPKAVACGATGEDPSPWDGLDVGQIERLAQTALAEPNRDMASRLVQQSLPDGAVTPCDRSTSSRLTSCSRTS
jgi:hypothetical protein